MIDLLIVCTYFVVIFVVAVRGRLKGEVSEESYFLSNRSLRWPSIAMSTIATNVQGYQFLGMMGSAYLYGLAQANLEINAVQGILLAAFVFVPLYLRSGVVTITQYIEKRLGKAVSLSYSIANIVLFSTITLGAALFWGAYAADLVFADYLSIISEDRVTRISIMIVGLGVFSAIYTYLGGLSAVVRTDIVQFLILLVGGLTVLGVTVYHLGGWAELYRKTPNMMHLHMPADHEKLPWTHLFGLFFLNINYWCANQSVIQRSLAAKNVREAQIGLMAGGLMKYLMAVIIIVPGIALVGILGEQGLSDPDMAFPYIVDTYLPLGVKGLILCALFASLMSTVDSTFNSLATLFSIDIYKGYLRPAASSADVVSSGRKYIIFALCTGVTMGLVLLYVKMHNPEAAFTHTLNELRYYINTGIIITIISAVLLVKPHRGTVLITFFGTIPLHLLIIYYVPDLNYFVRAGVVVTLGLLVVAVVSYRGGVRRLHNLFYGEDDVVNRWGMVLALSLIVLHVVFS